MNQFNALHGEETTEPPREWNIQPPADHFRPSSSPPKTSTMVSAIMGRLDHRVIDVGDIEVHPLYFPFESNSEYVPDTDTNPIKSIDDDELYHILKFFHSEHNDDLLGVDLQMLQD